MSTVRIFGIRHHGPGSTRRLMDALSDWVPDLILIELPADSQPLIDTFDPAELAPPVAMLLYDPKNFVRAAYFPFAEFSPEWQALLYGKQHQIPCRAIDLPAGIFFKNKFDSRTWTHHPFRKISEQTHFSDTEQWCDHFMEQQPSTARLFHSIHELMTVLRENSPPSEENRVRETYMIREIQKAKKEGLQKLAVICGAFHTPALHQHTEKSPRMKKYKSSGIEAVWIPWSYERLTQEFAYGAGVKHPAWYDILFRHGENAHEYWIARCVPLFREKGLQLSSATSIEILRLAKALQQMRGRRTPGLPELEDAITSVAFQGRREWKDQYFSLLYVSPHTGSIDQDLFLLPLQKDFRNQLRSARLSPVLEDTAPRQKNLDLRKKAHLKQSRFFYRTRFLGIPLATAHAPALGARGNFKETWDIEWDPSSEWTLIQAGTYGTTIEEAARQKMIKAIEAAKEMGDLTRYLEEAFVCGFEDIFTVLEEKIIRIYSLSDSVITLLESLRTLTFVDQYGDIRYKTKPDLSGLIDRIGSRAAFLLPDAIGRLTSDEDEQLRSQLDHLHFILTHPFYPSLSRYFEDTWLRILTRNTETDYYHGIALKYAIDHNLIGPSFTDQQFARHLSSSSPENALEWLQGLLSQQILWIAYDDSFLQRLNQWLEDMEDRNFQANLPVLRKIFSRARSEDRRMLFEKITTPESPKEEAETKKEAYFSKYADELFDHFFKTQDA